MYRILSCDGGGVRGVLTAALLEAIDADPEFSGFWKAADLYAGTSTGGIIALGLAAGKSPAAIKQLYLGHATDIFYSPWWAPSGLVQWLWAKYGNRRLKQLLLHEFGADTKLGDLKKVLVPAFDLDGALKPRASNGRSQTMRGWKPKFFHNFEIEGADVDEKVVDVALRTSAAPTYFPVYQGYVDGGVFANNPSLAAYLQAIYQPPDRLEDFRDDREAAPKPEQVLLLSVSTGRFEQYIEGQHKRWGYLPWVWNDRLLDVLLDSMVGIADWECEQLLGARYHRLDPRLPRRIDLDEYRAAAELADMAASSAEAAQELDVAKAWLRRHDWGAA